MKKIFVVFMILMFIMCLGGCDEKSNQKPIEEKIWCEFLNMDVDYSVLSDFVNIENINKIEFIKNFSSLCIDIEKKEIINDIINIIDVPYIDSIILSNNNIDKKDILFSDSIEFYHFGIIINDNFYIHLVVYSTGYVSMSINKNDISNNYISIVKVNFYELKNICKYENLWGE